MEGELVFATITRVTPHGAYARLEEFGGIEGFLHVSEVASGRVRQVERYARPQQKVVLKVIRVDPVRREVDLSLKQVTREEWRKKLVQVKKVEKTRAILSALRNKLNWDDDKVKWLMDALASMAPSPYDALEEFLRRGPEFLTGLGLSSEELKVLLEEARERIIPSLVEIRGIAEIRVPSPNGVEVIKSVLARVQDSGKMQNVKVHYLGAPRYMILVRADNFKNAEKTLSDLVESLREDVEEHGGIFSFKREEAKHV
jgi:translation initiation factor 2 subunit 1